VSIYKDQKQNKLREDLLNFNDEAEGYTEELSNLHCKEGNNLEENESEGDFDENNQLCGLEESEEGNENSLKNSSQREEISFDED